MSKYFRTGGVLNTSSTLGGVVRPSMVMNFDNGERLHPLFSCIRNSIGTYYDSLGILRTQSAGFPRIDHDPVTFATKGLLVEESRTNLLTYSEQFDNAAWTKANATITTNATTAPSGVATADALIEDTSNTGHTAAFGAITYAASTVYTATIFVKPTGRSWFYIQFATAPFGGANTRAWFNVTTGQVGTQANCIGSIQPVGNGWYRCGITATSTVGGAPGTAIAIGLSNADNVSIYTGDGTSGAFIWGAQIEAGALATSYIPTVATQVTRNADLIKCTDLSWLHPSQGTLYAEATPFSTSTDPHPIFALTNSTSNTDNAIWLGRSINNTVTDAGFVVRSGGTEQARLYQSSSWLSGNKSRVAGSYKSAEIREASNGTSASQTSGGIPSVSICYIGSVNENLFFNGHINHVAYYPSTSTPFELEYLTNSTWR